MALAFDPKASVFSLDNARLLGQAAAVSYADPLTCERWARSQGLNEDFDFFSSTGLSRHSDTQGFVAQNQDIVLVAFRGTQPKVPVDWMSDLEASHETWGHPIGKVHKGFYEALRSVWGQAIGGKRILPERLLNRGERTVWIAGHSLGGALAQLCAAQSAFVAHVPVQGVYTFGQPRVGDEAFSRIVQEAFGTRVFRFVNDRDIVPRVPFFGMGFRHYGCQMFFDHEQKREDGEASSENLAAALRLARLALKLDAVHEAAKMLFEATMQSGLLGNPLAALQQIVKDRERIALGASRALLSAGTENISDHDMSKNYLTLLGTSLTVS